MKNKYLVFFKHDTNFCLIENVNSEEEAFSKYCLEIDIQEFFMEYVHEKVVNDGLGGHFWNKLLPDPNTVRMSNEEEWALIEKLKPTFFEEIREYFEHHHCYAELFINHWESDEHYPECVLFPDEMIRFMFIKEMTEGDWAELEIINLGEIPCLR